MSDPSYVSANVNVQSDTLASLVSKTNQLLNSAGITTVTVDPNATIVNATSLGLSTGNGFVNGMFGANTLVASTGIQGGTIGAPDVLNFITNAVAQGTFTANGFTTLANASATHFNTPILTLSAYTVNTINSTSNSTSIGLSSNTEIPTTLAVKNYVANAVANFSSGSVTSVGASGGSTGLVFSGSPVTSTGTLTLANSSLLAIQFGGSGANTGGGALANFAGSVTNGQYLRANGTTITLSAIQSADVPTLNQNTTGNANNVTGIVAIVNGGSGASNKSAAYNNLTPITTTGDIVIGNGTNSATRLPIGSANTVLVSNGTTAAWQSYGAGFGAATLRNVTSAYSSGGQVFVQSSAPTASNAGDIWLQF